MKYLDLIKRDEDEIKEDEAQAKAELAENSAQRDLINMKHEKVKIKSEIERLKASENFSLREIVEKQQELKILEKDIAEAEEIADELF